MAVDSNGDPVEEPYKGIFFKWTEGGVYTSFAKLRFAIRPEDFDG